MNPLERIVAGLRDPAAYPHPVDTVVHLETHISHVLLAGDYAYKLKKPLNLGFLDFSTLERRRFCCAEEVRLNRRLAPRLYLGVVPVTGTLEQPRLGGSGGTLDYAVKMHRFDPAGLLSLRPLDGSLPERLAERIAAFHQSLPAAGPAQPYGEPAAILDPMRTNFAQIRAHLGSHAPAARLDALEAWTLARQAALRPTLVRRKAEGWVRECHGDMHRGNIALDGADLLIFDGIEFNPALRWIDTLSELAFLIMDLEEAGEVAVARRLLNRYLECSGDYEGLGVLTFYKVYRAMVRAKVIAIRLGQEDLSARERARDQAALEAYLDLAEGYVRLPRPGLYLARGPSGSGKSWLCLGLRAGLPLLHVRSDIERKRLFGLPEGARTRAAERDRIYAPEADARTYERLLVLARSLLEAGYSPLLDATFLSASRRAPFLALARERGVACTLLDCQAPEAVLRQRVRARAQASCDPSEADLSVLERQLAGWEPLDAQEQARILVVDTTREKVLEELCARLAAEAEARAT